MAQTIVSERMQRIRDMARTQLDRMDDLLPMQKPVDRDAYFREAISLASRDPEFKARFESAMAQYQAAGKEVSNATRRT